MPDHSLVAPPLNAGKVLAYAVSTVFAHRPIVITAALKQFTAALARLYPDLHINVLTTTLNVPGWDVGHERDNTVMPPGEDGARHSTVPLFEVMIASVTGKASLWFTSGHFLSDASGRRLDVEMREVEALLRGLPDVMIGALQTALADFWNEPLAGETKRWQWLADLCKGALLIQLAPGNSDDRLDAEQIRTLQQIAHCPQRSERQQVYGEKAAEAFLVRYQTGQDEALRVLTRSAVLVTRTVADREIILQFFPGGTVESFNTLQAFAEAQRVTDSSTSHVVLDVQPWTINTDVFVTLAQAMLDSQLERVADMGDIAGQDLPALESLYAEISDVSSFFHASADHASTSTMLDSVLDNQPDWLPLASTEDLLAYSRYLLELAALQQATDGRAYDDGIDSAAVFARHALEQAMVDFGPAFDPDALLVTQVRYQADAPGTATGTVVSETDTLTRRALKNLGGLLHAATTLRDKNGAPLPDWVNVDTLRELMSRADIGKAYPLLVKRELLGDKALRLERETRFANQLRLQLPMLALEYKVTGNGHVTEAGHRQVLALVQAETAARTLDLQPIVLRALAFVLDEADRTDVVSNQFVIGPQDTSHGPFLLYRPFYAPVFVECASWSTLLERIRDDSSINKSVLDWLEPDARRIYNHGGFTEPHLPRVIFDVDFPTITAAAPPVLCDEVVVGDVFSALYQANADVLVRQADEQTVSNAEYRWATLEGLGEKVLDSILGAVLPYLRGPAAAAGWLLTTESAVLNALRTLDQGDTGPTRQLLFTLLGQLAMAALVHRFQPGNVSDLPVRLPASRGSVSARYTPPIAATTQITDSAVDFSMAPSRDSRAALERYLQVHPDTVGPVIEAAPLPGIHVVDGRWYARVPGRISGWGWAPVTPAQGRNVHLLDRSAAPIKWLELCNNGEGLWDTAPEFRVRHGGGGASRLGEYVFGDPQLNAERAARTQRLQVLEEQRLALDKEINHARDAGNDAYLEFQQEALKLADASKGFAEAQGAQQAQFKRDMAAAQQKLRISNQTRLKAGELFVELQLKYIALLDKVRPVLDADEHFLREARYEFLQERLLRCSMTESALESVSSTPPELGYSKESVFPLAYDSPDAALGIPYNALFEARKRILKFYPQRIAVSEMLEATAAELASLDEQVSKGRRASHLLDSVKTRKLDTDILRIFEVISIRGALTGDPLVEPSMLEAAGLEGISGIPVGRVTWHLLELDAGTGYTPNERILLLKDAVRHYTNALGLAHYLERPAGGMSYVPEEFVRKFIARVTEFRSMAEEALAKVARAEVLGTVDEPVAASGKSRSKRTRSPTRRIIETAEGMVMGESSDETDEPDETVVATDPYSGAHTTYYRHDAAEPIYTERRVESPMTPVPPVRPLPGLNKLLKEARLLLAGLDEFKARVSQSASRQPEPKSQEDTLVRQANKLDETAVAINLSLKEFSQSQHDNAVDLNARLTVASQALRDEGVRLRIEGARRLPPTVGNLEYLLEKGEVRIGNSNWSDKSTASGGADFLLEFEVLDEKALASKHHKALWYAHFHSHEKNAGTMKKGHLKLAALRYKTYADQLREAQTSQIQAIESANISKSVATRLFFKRLPPGEQGK